MGSRFPFLVAVALIGAALSDPLVEALSDAGVFGPGYIDRNHAGVIPALVAGAILAFVTLVARCAEGWKRAAGGDRGRLSSLATLVTARHTMVDIPFVLALQLCAVCAIEYFEAIVSGGPLPVGLMWLGGPVGAGLVIHAFVGVVCLALVHRLLREAVAAFASLARIVLDLALVVASRVAHHATIGRRDSLRALRAQSPHVRQIGGRAPPPLPAV